MLKDILIGTDARGQTVCLFRKNGMAIYGRWVDGQYQTEVVRRGDALPAVTPLPPLYGPRIQDAGEYSLGKEPDAEVRARPTPPHISGTLADIATRRRQRAERNPLCPLCRQPWGKHHSHPRRLSRDHIKKRADGGGAFLFGDTVNIRWVCQECNGLLNRMDQCAGAVACWIAVTRREWRD